LLLPLEQARGGRVSGFVLANPESVEEAPEFAVEIVYFLPGAAWNDKGKAKLMLPALDLPVSRTGLLVYYPPLFRVNAEPGGSFRTETYVEPTSPVLNARDELFDSEGGRYQAGIAGMGAAAGAAMGGVASTSAPAPPPAKLDFGARDDKDAAGQAATNALLDKYRTATHVGRATGVLPIHVSFPVFGPSVYLVCELTSENQAPSTDLNYQPDKKGGSR
jgi:hypothetical protein